MPATGCLSFVNTNIANNICEVDISTSRNNGYYGLLVAIDHSRKEPLVFDSYEKEDRTRKSGYKRHVSKIWTIRSLL